MGRRVITTEEWVKKAKNTHGDKYDYSKTIYKTARTKVIIICKQHGEFLQIPNSHDRGGGCPKCAHLNTNKWTRHQFIKTLRNRVGDTNYKVVGDYFGTTQKILTENKYGVCSTIANNLLKGVAPHIESAIDKTTYWINMCKEVHGDRYDYSKVVFTKTFNKVEIMCKTHGSFFQTAYAHLSGAGCSKCKIQIQRESPVGWSYTNWKKAAEKSENFDSYKVYILKCWNENEEFYKIGRTYTTIDARFRGKKMPYNYEIIKIYKGNSKNMSMLEIRLHKINKNYKYVPKTRFGGMHECFENIEKETLNFKE